MSPSAVSPNPPPLPLPSATDAATPEKKKSKKRKTDAEVLDERPLKKEKKEKKKDKKEKKSKKPPPTPDTSSSSPPAQSPSTLRGASSSPSPEAPPSPSPSDAAHAPGHALILQKLRTSLARQTAIKQRAPSPPPPPVLPLTAPLIASGIQQLPQPAPTTFASAPISALSTLPPWLREPITISPSVTKPWPEIPNLSEKIQTKLVAQSLDSAFAVQTAVLPLLLDPKSNSDVCISAATGSGKTLSYLVPVVQSLLPRVVVRLRAIIVLPTRELVSQVQSVITPLIAGTGLKLGVAAGNRSLATEQAALVHDAEDETEERSLVDILITTPGRLVDHIRSTPGFSLRHVRWLVIDEADRLLAQSFQAWVSVVIGGLEKTRDEVLEEKAVVGGVELQNLGLRPKAPSCRKVVLSATMTRDVGKLADLRLRNPRLVVVEGGEIQEGQEDATEVYNIPNTLIEHALAVEDPTYKPLALVYLLHQQRLLESNALVFTRSTESAGRLAALLGAVDEEAMGGEIVGLVTGEMEKKRREKVMRKFRSGTCKVLICSDLISRGLDLPSVGHIINYDVPPSVQAYVHRVGRTARAGKRGHAWTLIEKKEGRWFWNSIGGNKKKDEKDKESGGVVVRGEGRKVEKVDVLWDGEGEGLRGNYERVLEGGM